MEIILVCQKEEFDEKHIHELEKFASVKWISADTVDLEKIPELFTSGEKIIALSPVPIGWNFPKIYSRLRNIRYLCLPTTSYEFLDIDMCRSSSIKVTNVPHYSTEAVANQAIFMMLGLMKRLPEQIKSNFLYSLNKKVMGDDILGKRAGIIGLGDIGLRLAHILSGMGMKVSYWSKHKKEVPYKYEKLESIIEQSDILFPTLISNKPTVGLLNKYVLEKIQLSAYVIGLIDSKVWDQKYLIERIKKGTLQGLAFESEIQNIHQFEGNILVLPPFAWYSKQSLENNIAIWTHTIISCLKDKPQNLV